MSVLVLQSLGGSADHVYVLVFKAGKASVALKAAMGCQVQVKRTQNALIVVVPPKTLSGPDGKFPKVPSSRIYSFPIE